VAWSVDKSVKDEPDLILNNGKWIPEGSGENHHYDFVNGIFSYKCFCWGGVGYLEVFRNDELIRNEKVVEVIDPGSIKE
nr:hypothetical protein [Leptospiraceae bacterium]